MPTGTTPNVLASNRLTAKWCQATPAGDFVLSGVGLWPLLAVLADAADGPARAELEQAIGIPAAAAREAALELLAILDDSASASAALGVWAKAELPLNPAWVQSLPAGVVERLAGQGALDAWANKHTHGMIEKFPLQVTPDSVLVLATALFAETTWRTPFQPSTLVPRTGPWAGHSGVALSQYSPDAQAAAILDGDVQVTRVIVAGDNDLDVHLLLGDAEPGAVLATGLGAMNGEIPIRTDLPLGIEAPGLTVSEERSTTPIDRLGILLRPFDIRSTHDLLAHRTLFGLSAASTELDNFPAISPVPLYISQGKQDALAQFSAKGFKAAAVTAFDILAVGMPPPNTHTIRLIEATFDRPFGFLAIHRPSGLALVAGWVATPPIPQPEGDADI
ncbi:serpin family protein [Nocardia sp. XZ_19_385]|uniref:serpin family protein n=1 Tax=Nocardia sp. XZ_19_385 TaxID=2769488 RepID=UPI00188FD52A|nr:serpin family protein [Nocardia sp. XZ_19_385]